MSKLVAIHTQKDLECLIKTLISLILFKIAFTDSHSMGVCCLLRLNEKNYIDCALAVKLRLSCVTINHSEHAQES